ncbi:MAG: sigma factor-like helix-turn-helix DNA-binding protein [Clostridia bacterium]|nr:sigma factor-like helix-turn-helix DNA-binding protein [Clostridia bacterium]
MAKDLKVSVLLDFYGQMLTPTQREVTESYYYDDLSLAEISEERGITRQGVRDAIKRSEKELSDMEDRLGLVKRFRETELALTRICDDALAIKKANGGANSEIDKLVSDIIGTTAALVESQE